MEPSTSVLPSLLVWLVMVGSFGPAMFAWSHAQPLDTYPYVVGALVGSAVGYPLVSWRAKTRPAGNLEWVFGALWAAPPFLGIAAALLANRYLDRSEPVRHPTRLLRVVHAQKSSSASFASWRGPGEESARLGSGITVPWDAKPPVNVVVETRAGFFGWEYIEAVRLKGRANPP